MSLGPGNRSNVETKEEGGIKDDSDVEHRRMIAPRKNREAKSR